MAEAKILEIRGDGTVLVAPEVEGGQPQVGQLYMRSGGMMVVHAVEPRAADLTVGDEGARKAEEGGDPLAQREVAEDHRTETGEALAGAAAPPAGTLSAPVGSPQ